MRRSRNYAVRAVLYALLAVLCVVSLAGARRMLRGVPLGSVQDVDSRTGAVKVDLGEADGVLRGMKFAVVDAKGGQVAVITPAELYPDMFWSEPPSGPQAPGIRPGMQVRWIFTPELSMLLDSRRRNTPDAWRAFAGRFPKSPFLPQLIRMWPEEMLREVDPDYYGAWKLYTLPAFEDYVAKHPGGAFAGAAEAEIKTLKGYEEARERERQAREKRAAEYQAEMKRQQELEDKVEALKRQRSLSEMHGRLINNSSEPVRFVFLPPSMMPATVVKPGEEFEINHTEGTYSYKVYAAPSGFEEPLQQTAEQQPLAEGTVDIMFDFWEVTYP